ncbi:uncharacterized protein LOC107265743 [Cephus cinctus]|uniref:Uncharacterized protein LOC107265743 n=1 Tax=Cephus cinctus TaxID=211228 RepID=A0AAJ7BPA6_CEPCN|nr:uncharacterized protein LOC107265743 [Cephus cinctus]
MKNILVLSLFVALYIVQASSRPHPQEDASVFDKLKQTAEDALRVAQNATNRSFEYAKHAVENGWHTAQQTAQRGIEAGKSWTQHASQDLTKLATAAVPTGASEFQV